VLGTPTVDNVTLPGRPLRGKAAEMAVYLACHPDGADTATIAEHLAPDARLRAARQQIPTNASNLRHVLGRAGGPLPGGYVVKRGANARYRLDPTTIDVDLWRLQDLLQRARLASLPGRAELLRLACDLYRAPLADGCDYEWVEPHRQKPDIMNKAGRDMLEEILTDPLSSVVPITGKRTSRADTMCEQHDLAERPRIHIGRVRCQPRIPILRVHTLNLMSNFAAAGRDGDIVDQMRSAAVGKRIRGVQYVVPTEDQRPDPAALDRLVHEVPMGVPSMWTAPLCTSHGRPTASRSGWR
jgi:hypothetical protein